MASNVDFGNTAFSGTITPSVPIVQPVVDQSSETFASGLTNGLKDANQIFNIGIQDTAQAAVAAKAKNAKIDGSLAGDISSYLGLAADAVDQGASRSSVLTKIRMKQNEWMANNPGQEANIQEFINKSISTTGLVPELAEDTPKEKADKAEAQAAYQLGWSIDPNAPDATVLQNYRQHKTDLQRLADLGTKFDTMIKQGQLITEPLKQQATLALHSTIASGLDWVKGTIQDGYDQLQGVTDPTKRADIIASVDTKISSQTALVDNMRTESGNAIDTSYMTDGYKVLLQNFKDVSNGTETLAQYKQEAELQSAKIQHNLLLDPETAAAFTVSKMSNFTDGTILEQMTKAATTALQQAKAAGQNILDPSGKTVSSPDMVNKSEDTLKAFDYAAGAIKNMVTDPSKVDAATVKETNSTLAGFFKSVASHSSDGDPTQLNAFVKFMADPNVGAYIEQHMKEIAPQISTDARQILEQNYQNVGVDLINERWGAADKISWGPDAGRPGSPSVEMSKAVLPVWNGAGIEFTVAPEFKNNAVVVAQAKKLTADISGPLNNMVRAEAHMRGSRDYQKIYDDVFAKRLWVAGEDVPGSITDLAPKASSTASKTNAYLDKVSAQESGGNPDATNASSSASGSFGIIDKTYNTYAKRLGLTGDKNDPANQKAVATAITKDNETTLEANNLPVTDANRYALHFLGPQDGPEVLSAPDKDLVADYVSPKVIKANPTLLGMTVGEFKKFTQKVVK